MIPPSSKTANLKYTLRSQGLHLGDKQRNMNENEMLRKSALLQSRGYSEKNIYDYKMNDFSPVANNNPYTDEQEIIKAGLTNSISPWKQNSGMRGSTFISYMEGDFTQQFSFRQNHAQSSELMNQRQ